MDMPVRRSVAQVQMQVPEMQVRERSQRGQNRQRKSQRETDQIKGSHCLAFFPLFPSPPDSGAPYLPGFGRYGFAIPFQRGIVSGHEFIRAVKA
jgi:hypothetical protein